MTTRRPRTFPSWQRGDMRGATVTAEDASLAGLAGSIITTEIVETGMEELDARLYNWQDTTNEPTGFAAAGALNTDSTMSFVDGTRVFTIEPAVTSFVIYQAGVQRTISSAQTTTIPDTKGLHYIYFDTGLTF